MCTKRHSAIKFKIISGLFALSAFNYAQAAPVLNSANGHYYELVNSALTFDNAKIAAESKIYNGVAGHLVTITDATEQTFVQGLGLQQWGLYWIGGKVVSTAKQWVTGETFSYANFATNEPTAGDYGLSMGGSGYSNKWSGQTTSTTLGDYIVEYDVKKAQTISFSPALTGTVGTTANLSATASSGLTAITFASSTPTICTISGTTLSFAAVGTCTVTANQAGNATYSAATEVSANIVVSNAPKTDQMIDLSISTTTGTVGQTAELSATASSGLTVTLASSPTTVCTISGNMLSFVGAGTCRITLNQAGNDKFNAAKEITVMIDVSTAPKTDQTISFSPALTGTVGTMANLSATASSGLTAITFASSPATVCTISGNMVSFVGAGNCIVTANQVGNDKFNAAKEVSATIVVSNAPKTDQTISFSPALTGTVGTTANLSATATSGLTAITFASSPATVCTISGNTVSFVSAGNCIVTANQVGNDKFNAAKEVSATIVVSNAPKTDQTISFSPALTGTVGTTANLSATATSGLTAITFASSPATVCTISGNTVSFVSAGNCIVTANQVGNDKFNAAKEVSANITVAAAQIVKKDQKLSLTSEYTGVAGETGILKATSDSGLTGINFTTSSKDICEISGSNITYKAEGTCTVTMTQAGNEQFNAATQNVDIVVMSKGIFSLSITDKDKFPILQVIEGDVLNLELTFKASTSDVGKKAKFYVTAATGNTVLMLTPQGFVPATEPLQSVNAKDIYLLKDTTTLHLYSGVLPAGKYTVYAAYQTTNSKQEATSIFTVKKKQEISFENSPQTPKVGGKYDLRVIGGGSNNPIYLTSTTVDICTVQKRTVYFIAEGSCTIEANQAGNDLFADTLATKTITIKSDGVFSINITDKDGKSITEVANNEDALNISLTLRVLADDVGKAATLYLSIYTGNAWLVLTNGQWIKVTGADVADFQKQPATSVHALPKDETIFPLYSGKLDSGRYTIYANYETADGKKVEAISILNITSKIYANAYTTAKNAGKSDHYATAYATVTTMRAGKPDDVYANTYVTRANEPDIKMIAGAIASYALAYEASAISRAGQSDDIYTTTYATAYDNARMRGASDAYATAYATAKSNGKPEAYVTGYADGYAIAYTYATSNAKYMRGTNDSSRVYIGAFEYAYAIAKNDGKSDSYAYTYAHAYATAVNAGKSYTNATAYATVYVATYEHARDAGKSVSYADAFAGAYAREKYAGKSDGYADAYATIYASKKDAGKSDSYADTYASAYVTAKNNGKSDGYADAYAAIYASQKDDGSSDTNADAYATIYANDYATAYERAKNNGKSDGYADSYANAYALARNAGESDADAYATTYVNEYTTQN